MSTGTPSSDSGKPTVSSDQPPASVPSSEANAAAENATANDATAAQAPVTETTSVASPAVDVAEASAPSPEVTPTETAAPEPAASAAATTAAEPVAAPAQEASATAAGADSTAPTANETTAPAADGPLKRKVKLAPNVSEDHVRPVGSSDAVDHGVASGTSDKPVPKKPSPVEIPKADDLDASIEAQLDAAMSNETVAAAATGEASDADDPEEALEPGSRLKGKVIQIHGDNAFLDAGLRPNVVIPMRQFPADKQPKIGDELEVLVAQVKAEEGVIEARLPTGKTKIKGNWDEVTVGQIVDCMVSKTNKGGLEVAISNLRGFMPSSQVELGFCNDLEKYVGQKLQVQITEVNPKKRNLVVSRRKLLQAEREESEKGFWEEVEVGQTFSGRVKTIKNYGAFIDIGPIDGFLHIGEISWSHINHPNEALKEDQTVDVKVLTVDPEKRKVGLGMRQLTQDPWASASERYGEGRTVEGKVTRTTAFGAFIQLERGIEGLVHISQLAWRRVGSVNEVLKVDDTKEFQVLEVDTSRKRISLSLKALEEKPASAKKDEPEDIPAPVRRKRTEPLKGGRSTGASGGGLFGNPNDFGG